MKYKAIGLTLLTICLFSFCNAQDLEAIEDSKGAFIGAINGVLGDGTGSLQYIPEYGYHIQSREFFDIERNLDDLIDNLIVVFESLGGTVEGLQDDDWLSLAHKNSVFKIVIRTKPNSSDEIEVWVDNEKRE